MKIQNKFQAWMHECDQWLLGKVQVSTYEIADWTWRDAFDDGMSPEDAAREAFEADDLGRLFLDLLDGEAGQTF